MKTSLKTITPLLLILLLNITNLSCKKEECNATCLLDKIEEIKSHHYNYGESSITEYLFQGQLVYYVDIEDGSSDRQYDVFNSNCKLIGYLGTIFGISKINGEDFYKNAKFVRIIWKG